MNVTTLTRSLSQTKSTAAFSSFKPDILRCRPVKVFGPTHLISSDPLQAGNDFSALLKRMGDSDPLTPKEKAYLPWMVVLRQMIWALGASEMDIELPLSPCGGVPKGVCDLLVHGGPKSRGVIEVKVISRGEVQTPRGRDLAQLGAYARLVVGRSHDSDFDSVYAGVAYIELESRKVRLYAVSGAQDLVAATIQLLRAA